MAKAKTNEAPESGQAGQSPPNPGQNPPPADPKPQTQQGSGSEDSLKGDLAPTPPGPGDGTGTDSGTTVKQAADMVRAFVAAVKAGKIWDAVKIGSDLLKLAADLGLTQATFAAEAVNADELADFVAAAGELASVKDHVVSHAPTLASGFVSAPDSGASKPLAAAAGVIETLSPNDILALYEIVSSAVALARRIFG